MESSHDLFPFGQDGIGFSSPVGRALSGCMAQRTDCTSTNGLVAPWRSVRAQIRTAQQGSIR